MTDYDKLSERLDKMDALPKKVLRLIFDGLGGTATMARIEVVLEQTKELASHALMAWVDE